MTTKTSGWRMAAAGLVFGCGVLWIGPKVDAAAPAKAPAANKAYELMYGATLDPVTHRAKVRIALRQRRQLVRSIEFAAPSDRYLDVSGQGRIDSTAEKIVWTPPAKGGVLHFDFVIDHRRADGAQDARITDTWALLKLDHLFPRSKARVVKGASSSARLRLVAPTGWEIETPYGPAAGHIVDVAAVEKRFDRPRGWMLAGQLNIRRDVIGERRVRVASPDYSGFRANDVLAFMRWTLPTLLEVLPATPPRLLIVGAPDGMWRGGLSGAASAYLHADRPLISANSTSTLLHELVHVASGLHATPGADWIIEGLAEYYSLEVLRRSDTISQRRYERAMRRLERWGATQKCLATDRSQGVQTARAALVMRALDQEIRTATQGKASLDVLVQTLVKAKRSVSNASFRADASALIGAPAMALAECP